MSAIFESSVNPEFDPQSETYRLFFDTDSSSNVSTVLVLSLCSVTETEPTEIRPLSRAIDPEVLESHLQGEERGAELSFKFHEHHVTVRDDGRVTFSPLDEE